MEIFVVGLGRMGSNMARRLMRAGHQCFVYDRDPARRREMEQDGANALPRLESVKEAVLAPRIVWMMLPAGGPTEETVQQLAGLLDPGDIVVDGGNSFFKDDIRRSRLLSDHGVLYLDVGVSGGVWGLERGYSLMIGGHREAAKRLEPIFQTLAPGLESQLVTPDRVTGTSTADQGYYYCGPAGAGHFVKMVHNGIEYGMMQALAEGFDVLQHASSPKLPAERRYDLNLREIAEVWRRGSVVSSWLLDLIAISLGRDPELSSFTGSVEDSGEGRWTIDAAIEEDVPVPVISSSLFVRFRSREKRSFAECLLSAMRSEFGGHHEAQRTDFKKEAS